MTRTHTHFEKIKIKIKQFKCFTSFNPTRIETKDFDVFFFFSLLQNRHPNKTEKGSRRRQRASSLHNNH